MTTTTFVMICLIIYGIFIVALRNCKAPSPDSPVVDDVEKDPIKMSFVRRKRPMPAATVVAARNGNIRLTTNDGKTIGRTLITSRGEKELTPYEGSMSDAIDQILGQSR